MAVLTLRSSINIPLTNDQVDANWLYLQGLSATNAANIVTLQAQVATLIAAGSGGGGGGVTSVNGKTGVVLLTIADIGGVASVNGRSGVVTLTLSDIPGAAPLSGPTFSGVPTAPTAATGTSTTQIATTAFVQTAVSIVGSSGVNTVNGRNGNVTLTLSDIPGAAPIAGPTFTGIPKGPTAANGTSTTQLATTAFVQTAIALGSNSGVDAVNGRTGNVVLSLSDIPGAAPIASPTFTGVPNTPTAANATSNNQIASTAFVKNVIATIGGVDSINGKVGAVVEQRSFGTAGYIKFTSGFIIQWSSAYNASDGNGNVPFNYPLAFPSGILGAIANEWNAAGWGPTNTTVWGVTSVTNTSLQARVRQVNNGTVSAVPGISVVVIVWGY